MHGIMHNSSDVASLVGVLAFSCVPPGRLWADDDGFALLYDACYGDVGDGLMGRGLDLLLFGRREGFFAGDLVVVDEGMYYTRESGRWVNG